MPNFKVVFQYTSPLKGWTEVLYRNATDLPSAVNIPQAVLTYSLGMRDQIVTLAKIRVSDVLNNRSSLVLVVGQSGTRFTPTTGPEVSAVSAVVNLVSTAVPSNRKIWVRGLTTGDVFRGPVSGADLPQAAFISALNAFINSLSTNGFTIRSLTKVGPAPFNFIPILTVGGAPGSGQCTLTFAAGPVFAVGQQITVSQLNQKTFPGLKGVFTITAFTATSVTIAYNSPVLANTPVSKGRLRLAVYNYGAIQNVGSGFSNFSTRSTGRSPLGGRGAKRGARGLRSA